jgi:arginine:ornithine antiporter/lysine permease
MGNRKLGFWTLTALVVGNMVGSGIFMIPRQLGEVASPIGVLLAWLLTGVGVLMIAFIFGNLSIRKPELTGGPQVYAAALFKKGTNASIFSGYLIAWGYWVANWAGNVAIITTFAGYLSTFFPVLTSEVPIFVLGDISIGTGNLLTFIICTSLLWFAHIVILNGIHGAGKLNLIATAAKVIGFMLFIVIGLTAFQASNLLPMYEPVTNTEGITYGLLGQVNQAAISTLWAFVGIESAVVLSARARKKEDISKSTVTGLIITLIIYIGISLLVMGILPHSQLIQSDKPLIDAFIVAVGDTGGYIMAALGLISLLGATLGWILLSGEVAYQSAKQRFFPKIFIKENKNGSPVVALTITNIMSQLFIFSTISNSISNAFEFVIYIATLAYLVPYIIATVYQIKLVSTGETYLHQKKNRMVDSVIAILGAAYSSWVIFAGTADVKTFLLGIGLLLSGILFYPFIDKSEIAYQYK